MDRDRKDITTCPCCGQRVSVSTADEGTCSYVGEEYNAAIEEASTLAELMYRDGDADDVADAIRALKKEGK